MICAPVSATESGSIALTVPAVPTGMKVGVSIAPCAVVRRPRRAAPARLDTAKANGPLTTPAPCARAGRRRHRRRSGNPCEAGEGRDQHEEGRARQVEIGEEYIDRLEAVAWGDEDVGVAVERRDGP